MARRLTYPTLLAALVVCLVARSDGKDRRRKQDEPKPQVLELPKELPKAIQADPHTLSFPIFVPQKGGRLTKQIQDALNELVRENRNGTIVKLRALVSGAGDSRRVQDMVSELFTEKHLPLPVLTILQVGDLNQEGSAVAIEAIVAERKPVNPRGLAFLSGQYGDSIPLATATLTKSLTEAGLTTGDVLHAVCFADRLQSPDEASLRSTFPQATVLTAQAARVPAQRKSMCEAVARSSEAAKTESTAQVRFANGSNLVFTGLQLSFGNYLADADSALSRLQRDVAEFHTNLSRAVLVNAFSTNLAATSALEKTASKFRLDPKRLSVQWVEGLPALDALLGIEAILTPEESAATGPQKDSSF